MHASTVKSSGSYFVGMPTGSKSSNFCFLDNAEQVAVRILQHHEIVVRPIPPRVSSCPQTNQPLHLGIAIVGVEIQVQPASFSGASFRVSVQRQIRALAGGIAQDDPTFTGRLARLIVERLPPEAHR